MSTAELKSIVERCSAEERRFLRKYLDQLEPAGADIGEDDLDAAWESMRQGDKIPLSKLRQRHDELASGGR